MSDAKNAQKLYFKTAIGIQNKVWVRYQLGSLKNDFKSFK